jgi:4-hydroxybenzoate polyprenyltransferase
VSEVLDYLRIARAQTAAVEGAGFPLAAWIGGAPLWILPLFALFGIFAHFGGFGQNSITDLEYDRRDPNKQDHPVVAGRVRVSEANAFVYGCQILGILIFVMIGISHLALTTLVLPCALLGGYVLLGTAYNLYGKRNKPLAVLEISGAFTLAFLAAGTLWTGHATTLVWTVGAYAFVFTAFQIALAGEVKELAQAGERNLLRRLGSRILPEEWFWPGILVVVFGFILSFGKAITLGAVAWEVDGSWWYVAVFFVSWMSFTVYTSLLLRPGPFDRGHRVRVMGIGEAGSYLLLVLALAPALWPWLWVPFIVLPVLWFVTLNRALWSRTGSAWAPGV